MKAYTDIEQSKKLAEILPIESADMGYDGIEDRDSESIIYDDIATTTPNMYSIPCWSLVALLGVLPNYQLQTQDDGTGILCSYNGKFNIITADNPIDACYEMILKLHE